VLVFGVESTNSHANPSPLPLRDRPERRYLRGRNRVSIILTGSKKKQEEEKKKRRRKQEGRKKERRKEKEREERGCVHCENNAECRLCPDEGLSC